MAQVFPRKKQVTGGAKVKAAVAGEEFVIATLPGIDTTPENPSVQLDSNVVLTTAAEDTEIIIRIRRGGLAGTLLSKVTTKPGASAKISIGIQVQDNPGECIAQSYVLTCESVAKKATESEESTLQAIY